MLSALIISLPVVALLTILSGNEKMSRRIALALSLVELVVVAGALVVMQQKAVDLDVSWIPALGIRFHLGLDGISAVLTLLTALLYPFIIGATRLSEVKNPKSFYALMMLMQVGLLGVFMARDAFLFYVFYELSLVPIYFICGRWGGERSIPITLKFFIYTFAGSLFMLVAILYLYFKTPAPHTFDITAFYHLPLSVTEQSWIFWAFFVAFAVKIPIFPLHTWQPDTYTVSPTAGTMLLAGIMLKMAVYGFIRFTLPIVPEAVALWGHTGIILCIIGIMYASAIALRQNDLKRLIAYSSIAHVGLIAAGTLSGTVQGVQGAILQMFNHGVNVVALFFMIDIVERNYGTRWMPELSGVASQMKKLSWLFLIVLLGSIGLPLTNGFIGEFLLLNGLYEQNVWYAAIAGLTLIFGAAYMFRFYRNVFWGESKDLNTTHTDVNFTEQWMLIALCALVLFVGIYPAPLLQLSQATAENIIQVFQQSAVAMMP